jgi:deoxyribonuclease V
MKIKEHHSWDLSYNQAIALQNKFAEEVIKEDKFGSVEKIAGVDVKYVKETNEFICAVLIFLYPSLKIIETKYYKSIAKFPYIPGLLSFREGPAVEGCFAKIKNVPDIVFFDGHGYCHPRRFGLASHLGVLLDLPSIGCAKKKLCGNFDESLLGVEKGSYSEITDLDASGRYEVIGAALRTRDGVKPVFVSSGYRISLSSAIKCTLSVSRSRIPEPTRFAHNYLKSYI